MRKIAGRCRQPLCLAGCVRCAAASWCLSSSKTCSVLSRWRSSKLRTTTSHCVRASATLLRSITMEFLHPAMTVCAMSQTQISGYLVCGEAQSIARACLHLLRMGMHAVRQTTASEVETWPRNRQNDGLKHLEHKTLDKHMRNRYPSDVLGLRCV